jgi:hypothetical protein
MTRVVGASARGTVGCVLLVLALGQQTTMSGCASSAVDSCAQTSPVITQSADVSLFDVDGMFPQVTQAPDDDGVATGVSTGG